MFAPENNMTTQKKKFQEGETNDVAERWTYLAAPPAPSPIISTGSTEWFWLAAEWGLAHPVPESSQESDHSCLTHPV